MTRSLIVYKIINIRYIEMFIPQLTIIARPKLILVSISCAWSVKSNIKYEVARILSSVSLSK